MITIFLNRRFSFLSLFIYNKCVSTVSRGAPALLVEHNRRLVQSLRRVAQIGNVKRDKLIKKEIDKAKKKNKKQKRNLPNEREHSGRQGARGAPIPATISVS